MTQAGRQGSPRNGSGRNSAGNNSAGKNSAGQNSAQGSGRGAQGGQLGRVVVAEVGQPEPVDAHRRGVRPGRA